MLNETLLIQTHNNLSVLLEKALKARLMIIELKSKIAEYKNLPSLKKYQSIYTESDYLGEQKKYERYYKMLVSAYDKMFNNLINQQQVNGR